MARGRVRGITGHTRVPIAHGWEVAPTPAGQLAGPAELDRVRWAPAHVPGTAASALPAHGDYDAHDWWWRAPVDLAFDAEPTASCTLGFDGVATLWDAWVDGVHVATGDSMWAAREVRIERGARELAIRCRSLTAELAKKRPRPRWKVPMLEQQQLRWIRTTLLGRTPGWSPPYPAVGPWRGVWLERRVHDVGDVSLDARLEHGAGIVEVAAELGADRAHLVVSDAGGAQFTSALELRDGRWRGSAVVPDPARWWPHTHGEPARYRVAIQASRGGVAFAVDLGHTGFRTLDVDLGAGAAFRVRVNGVPIFCRGACWTPLDAVTLDAAPEAYDAAVQQAVRGGMNMLRVGGTMTYEADAFYDALDAHGVLLWQDLMCANMDYPDELADALRAEVREQGARLQARPALAIVCGNSEGEQQAAMFGATRDRWEPALFHAAIPEALHAVLPRIPYVPSSATSGAFPHASNAGPSSYYGVGAYLRPLDDARRAEVRFASECLAFANVPAASGLPGGGALRVHHAAWKARSPRDLGAGWDFDDVRDHYVQRLFGVEPAALRAVDHERYLALGRVATGEVMARTFGEWRRGRSVTGGGLVWFLRDLWPGAGWGVVDAHGRPKLAWYALRRALAPLAVAITDEGTNGLAIHVANDGPHALAGELELAMWRAGEIEVGRGARAIEVPARGALELPAMALFDGFHDLSFAYRFGPPVAHAIRVRFTPGGAAADAAVEAFWFPAGLTAERELDVGLAAVQTGELLEVRARRFAQFVTIDLPGWLPADDGFHLAPGQRRTIALARTGATSGRGSVTALNADTAAKIESAQPVDKAP